MFVSKKKYEECLEELNVYKELNREKNDMIFELQTDKANLKELIEKLNDRIKELELEKELTK